MLLSYGSSYYKTYNIEDDQEIAHFNNLFMLLVSEMQKTSKDDETIYIYAQETNKIVLTSDLFICLKSMVVCIKFVPF